MPNEKEYLAKKSLLNTKQDLLTPGDNITIINNRISAQAPVVDVLVNNQSVIGLDSVARVEVDTVSPNPIDTPTDTLTSVEINGTVYELQGGGGNADYVELTQAEYDLLTPAEKMNGKMYFITDGGGGGGGSSSVVPNPQGTPTDTLNTIEIDDVIYDIAGSGGGTSGGVYTETVLWEDPNGLTFYPQSPQTITLSESIDKFDLLYLDTTINGDTNYHNTNIVSVKSLYRDGKFNGVVNIGSNVNNCPSYAVVDETHLTLVGYASVNPMVAWKVVGIKVSGNYFTPQIYSLEEREIGAWKNDKPLYQKTFTGTISSTSFYIPNTTDMEEVAAISGYVSDGSYKYNIPYRDFSDYASVGFDSNGVRVITSNYFSGGTFVLTVQYTKISDTAGSGNYDSLGVPMVHYDDTERVVGTYFGETLYQKTIPNISITGTTTTIQTGENIGSLVAVEATGYKIDGGGNIIRFKESYNDGGDRLDVEGINNDIRVICSSWFNGSTVDITIKYTKSST